MNLRNENYAYNPIIVRTDNGLEGKIFRVMFRAPFGWKIFTYRRKKII